MFSGPSRLCYMSEMGSTIWFIAGLAVVESWEELPNIWSTVAKNAFVGELWISVHTVLKGAVTVFSVLCYLHCTIRVINSGHRNTHRPLPSSPESPHNKLLSCEVRIFLWSGYIKQSEFIDRGCTVLKVDTMLSIFYLAFKAFIKLYRFVHCDIYNSDGTTLKSVLSPSGYLCTRACGKLEVGN